MLIKDFGGDIKILLQRRKNTGFADGLWDLSCSGHVEENESMINTCSRECEEELGLKIYAEDFNFFALIHKRDRDCDLTYYNGYFYSQNFLGEPEICEPEKCSEISWFSLDNLPDDMIDDRRQAV
ncbi:MAG: NUDIX domain-containing protein, partial [Candidatus Coproplasma sp.]